LDKIVAGGNSFRGNRAYNPNHKSLYSSPIELVDPQQCDTMYVAFEPSRVSLDHTHCEIHPTTVMGLMGTIIPFAPHNAGVRNQYSTSQSKQAVSV